MSNPGVPSIAPAGRTPSHHRDHHMVQLYTDDAFLVDVLSRFVGGALAAGEAAIVLATPSHRRDLERRLSARGSDTMRAALQGRYITLDAAETLNRITVNGAVDPTLFNDTILAALNQAQNAVNKNSRVAVFGELVALLWAEGKPQEAILLEQLWNRLAEKHSFSLLCAYPITGFKNEEHIEPFLRMCREHSAVSPSESYMGLESAEDRLRNVALLEQKAQVLERELSLRQSEEQFRALVEAVQDYAIFMLDPSGKVSSWNLGAARIKQYTAAEIIGKHFSCFYPEEDIRNGKPQWELVIAEKEGRCEDEGWRVRKDGSRFWANVVITAVRDHSGKLIGFAKVTRDVTERMKAERALQKEVDERRAAQEQLHGSERSLRQLSLHLLRTQDEERRRIGRDLHDSLGQCLSVLKMKLDSLASPAGLQSVHAAKDLARCASLTDDCIKEVRTVSYLLYPPLLEEMGLKSAIPWYLEGFSARSGIDATFEVSSDFDRLPRDSELALFRVLQESLTNVHRHSGSPKAHVRLAMQEGWATLDVEDQGKGIPPQLLEQSGQDWMGAHGVGLRGMSERIRQLGGKLMLVSNETGTKVSAVVPAAESSSAAE